jgi:hypothetical protein
MISSKTAVGLFCVLLLSAASVVWTAPTEVNTLRNRLFPGDTEGIRLIQKDGQESYYILVLGGNPFKDSDKKLARRLELRAHLTLFRHLVGNKTAGKVLEISSWRTLGVWQEGAVHRLLANVDKKNLRLVETTHSPPAEAATGKQNIERVTEMPHTEKELARLRKSLTGQGDTMGVWLEIRELCRLQGDIECINEALDAIMDLKMNGGNL